jgi:DHA2 family multidrug resistance protein
VSNFVRITFGAIGASISTTVWDNRTTLHHAQLTEHANVYNPAFTQQLDQLTSLGMSQAQALGVIERNIQQQAAMLGANDIFWISGVLFFVLIVFVWMTKRYATGGGGGCTLIKNQLAALPFNLADCRSRVGGSLVT